MYNPMELGKRVMRKRETQKHFEGCLQRIKNVRPNTTGLNEGLVMLNNGKKQMLLQDKYTEIQRQNRLLLQKITTTMNKRNSRQFQKQKMNKSLNQNFRKKQMQNIEIQNARMLKRLQEKKSDYQTEKFNQDWKKQKEVIKNIASFPLVLEGINKKQRRRGSFRQLDPRSTYNKVFQPSDNFQLMRIRNFNGVNIVITIKMDEEKLTILGDPKKNKEVKIIEIPKDEALEFIDVQCNGRIELLFDCLSFDEKEETLYLIAKNLQQNDHQQTEQGPLLK